MVPLNFTGATFDSRLIKPGMLFIALKGESQDGHAYIPKALEAGAVGVIDGYDELNKVAQEKRTRLKAKVIAVTGSAGKTTTKELLRTFLAPLGKVHATEGNFNNHIGLPVTILNCPDDAEYLVLEMGTNHPGEIENLCRVASPDIGVITNIGTAHLEYLGSQAGIAEEKGTLFAYAKEFCVACSNCTKLEILREKAAGKLREVDPAPSWLAQSVAQVLSGAHNLSNAALAFAVASSFGLSQEQACAALSSLRLPGARWRKVDKAGIHFIDDTYNANPDSMKAALRAFAELPKEGRKFAILGDMFELGAEAPRYHKEVLAFAKTLWLDGVFVVGEMFAKCAEDNIFASVAELKVAAPNLFTAGDTVLLKASHSVQLGEILV